MRLLFPIDICCTKSNFMILCSKIQTERIIIMKSFDFKLTNIFNNVKNYEEISISYEKDENKYFNLRDVLKDLFLPQYEEIKENRNDQTLDIKNQIFNTIIKSKQIVHAENKKQENNDSELSDICAQFIPTDIINSFYSEKTKSLQKNSVAHQEVSYEGKIQYIKEKSHFSNMTSESDTTYTLGNFIRQKFKQNNSEVIKSFEEKCEYNFKTKYDINYKIFELYLGELKKYIIPEHYVQKNVVIQNFNYDINCFSSLSQVNENYKKTNKKIHCQYELIGDSKLPENENEIVISYAMSEQDIGVIGSSLKIDIKSASDSPKSNYKYYKIVGIAKLKPMHSKEESCKKDTNLFLICSENMFKSNYAFQSEIFECFYEKKDFAKLFSRILLSLILIQHKKFAGGNHKIIKNYFLNEDKYIKIFKNIWTPVSENEKVEVISRISNYFYQGRYQKVYEICDSNKDFVNAKPKLKKMYAISKVICSEEPEKLEKELTKEDTGLAWYTLFKIYNGNYSDKLWSSSKATEALEKAINKNETEAILIKIKDLYKKFECNYNDIDKLLLRIDTEKASPMQKSMYYFYKGLCLDKNNKYAEAQYYYQEALKLGNKEALNFLEKKPRNINDYEKKFSNKLEDKICIINAFNDNSITLLQSLPEDYCVCTISDVINKTEFSSIIEYNNIKNCLNNILINIERDDLSNKKVIIALLSDNDDNNLNCCLEILDRLFNAALNKKDDKSKLYKFIDTFKIFVKCNYEYASTFIDASISNMGNDIYFETKIIDPYKDAIHNLLYQRPLFIPCLVDNEKDINIAICGSDTKFNLSTVKEAMSVGYIGSTHHVNINIYSKNYKEIKDRMTVEMPGLQLDNLEGLITPNCIENDFTVSELYSEINNYSANYIIVNIGNDIENILFAIELRRYLLINSSELNRKPFIAVYCQNPNTAFLANRMTLSNVRHEEQWYNNYDLHFFGMLENTYSFDSLVNRIAEQALAVHFAYCDKEYTGKHNEKNHDTYNSYYSYKYNEDSSINTAITLRYRLFVANCYENRSINEQFTIESYASDENIKKYQEMCEGNLEEYSKIEQIRWNNFMITRGWLPPTIQQLKNYLQNPKVSNHKYMLAKLHPYIANWDDLDDDGEICNTIDESPKPFKSPKAMTKNNVKKTTDCLTIFKEKEQKKQLEIEH